MKVAHLSEPAEERVVFRDGLGVREWRDTGTGERVEWCHLDPAFIAAEIPLKERVSRLAKFQHVKFARILGLEPSRKGKGPTLVSAHVPGTRLGEVLEMAGHGLVAFDPGAALQVTREVLGALALLHDSRNVTHGALAPERVVLTTTGRVVIVEHVLAQALDRLQVPRHQLWRDWRIATPPAPGTARFDIKTDLAQLGLLALAAVLGRPIEEEEYPHRLRGLLLPAQDRLARSPAAPIAADVAAWLERLMPIESRRAFGTMREAQQAFEALVSPKAAAIGIAPSRVKGVVAAITAISTHTVAATEAPSAPAAAVGETPVIATAHTPSVASADDIDIEALLRLEAELEGGSAPVSTPVFGGAPAVVRDVEPTAVVDEPVVPDVVETATVLESPIATPDEIPGPDMAPPVAAMSEAHDPPLDALVVERLELERQLAALVDAVAPEPPAPVRLIPETPETAESLVDARVLWSSMPVDNLVEPSAPDGSDAAADPALAADAVSTPEPHLTPFVFEPIAVSLPEERGPAAAMDHVPAEWWREALPWRDETPAQVDADAPIDAEAPASATPSLDVAEPLAERAPAVDAAWTADLDSRSLESPDASAEQTCAVEVDAQDALPGSAPPEEVSVVAVTALEAEPVEDIMIVAAANDSPAAAIATDTAIAADDTSVVDAEAGIACDVAADTPDADITDDRAVVGEAPVEAVAMDLAAPAAEAHDEAVLAVDDAQAIVSESREAEAGALVDLDDVADGDDDRASAPDVQDDAEVVADGDVVAAVAAAEWTAAAAEDVATPMDVAPANLAAEAPSLDVELEALDSVVLAAPADMDAWSGLPLHDTIDGEALAAPVATLLSEDAVPPAPAVSLEPVETEHEAQQPAAWTADAAELAGEPAAPVGWFSRDALPVEADDLVADAPLATGGFRAFGVQDDESSAAAATDDGPALRTSFAFPEVTEDTPAPVGYFDDLVTEAPVEAHVLADDETSAIADVSPAGVIEAVVDADEPLVTLAPPPAADESMREPDEPVVAADVPVFPEPVLVEEALPGSSVLEADGAADAAAEAETEAETYVSALEAVDADAPIEPVVPIVSLVEQNHGDLVEEQTDEAAAEDPAEVPALAADPSSGPEPAILPEAVPEVVIVDEGLDRNAWDQLPSEAPAPAEADGEPGAAAGEHDTLFSDASTVLTEDEEQLDEPSSEAAAMPQSAAASRKKRRRSRRKKGQPAAPAISVPQPPVNMPVPVPTAVVAPVLAVAAAADAAPTDVPFERDAHAVVPQRRSLLDREVPTWTPSESPEMQVRPLLRRPEPVVEAGWAAREELAPAPVAHGAPAASGRDSAAPPAPGAAYVPSGAATPPPIEPVVTFEPEIRAVGMPDLEEILPRGGRTAVTSMAEAIGPTPRSGAIERPHVSAPAAPEGGSWNWRRLIAASVLIALFNGAAFAAWWWVQPGAYGTLVVQTAQSGVEVVIDGKAVGKTPFREEVAPGRHKLTLRHNGQVREMPVEITLGVVTTQALEWPVPEGGARGHLQVTSTPTGAKVYVNGELKGEAPLLIEDLPAGKQELTLRGESGSVTVNATVVAGETTPLEVPIFAGWVVVDAPVEMSLMLRGAKIGSTMDGQILLSPGRHQIEAISEALGFRRTLSVTIEPGEVKRVAVIVPPAQLQVQDEPGSEVFVDGDRVGTLPGVLKVPLGTHDVLVRRPDGSERRQTVTVRAGDTAAM